MLSILIPTYNYNITHLVNELHRQAMNTYVDFEILVMEDGSTQFVDENKAVADLKYCKYTILTKNIGRSAIRNRLADDARFNHLLFLDCDSEVIMPHFIEKYIAFCKENSVVVGGTAYDTGNKNPKYSLRLKYGRLREAKSALEREKDGLYSHFSAFNFLISKSTFNQIRFDEDIQGYGHEDTLFGHKIAELKCIMHHIDNPLLHRGWTKTIFSSEKPKKVPETSIYCTLQENIHPSKSSRNYCLNSISSRRKILSVFWQHSSQHFNLF